MKRLLVATALLPRRAGLLLARRDGRRVATAAVKPGELLKAAGIGP